MYLCLLFETRVRVLIHWNSGRKEKLLHVIIVHISVILVDIVYLQTAYHSFRYNFS